MQTPESLRSEIESAARSMGISLIRAAPSSRWPAGSGPRSIAPWAESVVVIGAQLPVPMVMSAPSMTYQELYNTTNRILDDSSYRIAVLLSSKGYRSMSFPRDGYIGLSALLGNPDAAFSHVVAAVLAGMGTVGDDHNLITKEFGPRVRIATVITDAVLDYDDRIEEDLCVHCGRCLRSCPSGCFTDDGPPYTMDKDKCTQYHISLKGGPRPCGTCLSVCPVGDDLLPFRREPVLSEEGLERCRTRGIRSTGVISGAEW